MKKILLGIGTLTTIVVPLSAVIACSSDTKVNSPKKISESPKKDSPTINQNPKKNVEAIEAKNITLKFNENMTKSQFEAELKKYTVHIDEAKRINNGDGTKEEILKRLQTYYDSMPDFTFLLGDLSMEMNLKVLTRDHLVGIEDREKFEPELHKLADKLGSTIHFDFS